MTRKTLIACAVLLGLPSYPVAADGKVLSEERLYEIRATSEPSPPRVGDNTVLLTVSDARTGAKVTGAIVEVSPWMPEHDHGSSRETIVTEKGGGIYLVRNVYLTMKGSWCLLLTIKEGTATDRALVPLVDAR